MAKDAAENLRSRWRSTPQTNDLDRIFRAVVDAISAPGAEAERLRRMGRLSNAGIAEQVREDAARRYGVDIAEAFKIVEQAKAELAAKRMSLGTPKINRDDLYELALRGEARTFLRGLKSVNEVQSVLSRGHPLFISAIAEVPPEMTGVSPEMQSETIGRYVREHHQDEIDKLAEREEGIDALLSAAQIAVSALKDHAGLADRAVPVNGNGNGGEVLPSFSSWMAGLAGDPAPKPNGAVSSIDYDKLTAEANAKISSAIDAAMK